MTYEDRLYIWVTALRAGVIGKIAPAVTKGPGSKTPIKYAVLMNDARAYDLLNDASDLPPVTVNFLRTLVKEFGAMSAPYPSFPYKIRTSDRMLKRREYA